MISMDHNNYTDHSKIDKGKWTVIQDACVTCINECNSYYAVLQNLNNEFIKLANILPDESVVDSEEFEKYLAQKKGVEQCKSDFLNVSNKIKLMIDYLESFQKKGVNHFSRGIDATTL